MSKKITPEVRFEGFEYEWESDLVGNHYFFKNGLNKSKEFFGIGSPIINYTDVFYNRTLFADDIEGRVLVDRNEMINYSVQSGDILFTRTSETINEIGLPSVVMDKQTDTVFSGFLLRARAIDIDPMDNRFKSYVFFTDTFREEMTNKSTISTRALTSGTSISKMLFSYPKNQDEQIRIGNFFIDIDKRINNKEIEIVKLKNFKQAMLQKMFPKEGEKEPEVRFKGFSEEWEDVYLKDILSITTGSLDANESTPYGKYPFFTTSATPLKIDEYGFIGPAITLAGNGVMGNSTYIPSGVKFNAYQRVYVLTQYENNSYYPFINQSISKYLPDEIKKRASGSVISYITKDVLEELIIKLPLLEEQQNVGRYILLLERNIQYKQKNLEKLKQFKKAMLQKMFV